VLGGGAGALAAAFELTATPELRETYSVTVHTLGWRLGGKGASGRNASQGQRIEEHGLHIWFGFYDNAFDMIRRCYEELGRPPQAPLAKWTDAFKPLNDCVQYERFDGQWVPHHFTLPPNPLVPGDHRPVEVWQIVRRSFDLIEDAWLRLERSGSAPRSGIRHAHIRGSLRLLRRRSRRHAGRGRRAPLELRAAAWLTRRARNWVWRSMVRKRLDEKGLRLFFMWLDLAAAMLTGIVRDRLVDRGFGAINDEDFRSWLTRHGASPLTVEGSPVVRAIYDAAFCYVDGDPRRPNVAAGKAAQDLIRSLLLYKGALMYKMQAGMGDTVFAPLYEVLRSRGVRFEFFQNVTRVGTDASGASIEEIDFVPQATVKGGAYDPLIMVKGLPCWPSEPDWAQLREGDELATKGVNLEQCPNPLGNRPETLRRGEDFDVAVLGIPVGALAPICEELSAANERFSQMLEQSHTVMTQALQLWLKGTGEELGFPYHAGSLASCFAEPLDTYCDMNQLLDREDWTPADEVRQIAYFCGVLPHAGVSTQQEADGSARAFALTYLNGEVQTLWPRSAVGAGFDWSLVCDGTSAAGQNRLASQYVRANFTGSERYVLTLAGSVRHRLWPGKSGFGNLFLAGDWTRNGIDGGSVEAAVTSGMLAARAITGRPAVVPGTKGLLESDRGEHDA
jgi:uncharacterized protein with NAD-binding domain and iron-sulfur cluster